MALVLLIQPKTVKTSTRVTEDEYKKVMVFVSRHFMTLDLRMCKTARKVRNHVMRLSEMGARADFSGGIPQQARPRGRAGAGAGAGQSPASGARGTNFLIALQNDPEVAREIDSLREGIAALLYGPKVEHPVWLGIVGWSSMHKYFGRGESKGKQIFATNSPEAVIFLNRLCDLEPYDTPRWNNFVSAAVTAVLSTHKAWVGTVSTEVSEDALQEAAQYQLHTYGGSTIFRNYIEKQLSDFLGGSLGGPLARATIVGKNVPVLEALLEVLSFFLRAQSFLINTSAMLRHADSSDDSNTQTAQQKLNEFSLDSATTTTTAQTALAEQQHQQQESQQTSARNDRQDGSTLASSPSTSTGMPQLPQPAHNESALSSLEEDVKGLPGGASLNVVPLEERDDNTADIRVMASSAEGPARALYGGVLEHFQPDLVLMGVTEPYERVLDALYEELQFEQELYSEYLGPSDTPVAVLGDMNARVFELVSIVPTDEDEDSSSGGSGTGQQQQTTTTTTISPAKDSLGRKAFSDAHNKKEQQKAHAPNSAYTNEQFMKTAEAAQPQRRGMRRSTIFPSTHVLNTLETAKSLWKLGISADTCIMYIEDRLHEIVSMAKVLMEYLRISPSVPSREQVESELQLGPGDLSLVASLVQGSKKWPLV